MSYRAEGPGSVWGFLGEGLGFGGLSLGIPFEVPRTPLWGSDPAFRV